LDTCRLGHAPLHPVRPSLFIPPSHCSVVADTKRNVSCRGRPCLHDGPCDASARPECACFNNRAHCESGCRCGRKCACRPSRFYSLLAQHHPLVYPACLIYLPTVSHRTYLLTGTRRWVGCACTAVKGKGPGTCRTQRCACYLAHRECDPELCGKCQAK
jgi:histone-lysine N-methyltransferase EZH2